MYFDFRKSGVFAVRFTDNEGKNRLLQCMDALGIRTDDSICSADFMWPQRSCVFAVDIHRRALECVVQPSICAAMASSGVRFFSAEELCALSEKGFPRQYHCCPVFHVPHDGAKLPEDLMRSLCVSEETFRAYHEKMRDVGMQQIIPEEYRLPYQSVCFDVSRLLCDVERFIGPDEIMERYGMGYCYERAFDGVRIKNVTDELRRQTLEYYTAHHARMDELCRRHKRVLVFDLHSYSDEIIPADFLRSGVPTPDVCIGADERYTPKKLVDLAEKRFSSLGLSVAVNYPYSGSYVPNAVLSGECRGVSIMLEFNRRCYCSPDGSPLPDRLALLRTALKHLTADCAGTI